VSSSVAGGVGRRAGGRPRTARLIVLAVALALAAGLFGAYRYWESYYQHRGFNPVVLRSGARTGHRELVWFYSPALHRRADYLVYLPPGYDPARRRYPTYYLLHGSPGRPEVFTGIGSMGTRLDNLISLGRVRPMILVFPDGRIDGDTYSDSEWANTRSGQIESYVVEVVHDVDRRFATLPERSQRVIGGFSAGAYGATNVALHHLSLFGNLQSWSGYYRQTRTGVFAHATPRQLAANSPLDYVGGLGQRMVLDPLRAFLFVGRDDDASPQEKPMAAALAAAGAEVSYALYHGGHDWQLWHAHLNQMIVLAGRDVSRPLLAGGGSAHTITPGVVPIPHGRGRGGRTHRAHRMNPVPPFTRPRPPGHGLVPRRIYVLVRPASSPPPLVHRLDRGAGTDAGALAGGLILALFSAALINLGFLLQHRGLAGRSEASLLANLRQAVREPVWLSGQLLGWVGFITQIVAVAIAPLGLVQAFAAGGLALSVPLAARLFGQRVTPGQRMSVLLMAAGLAVLPLGYGASHDHLRTPAMIAALAVAVGIGIVSAAIPRSGLRAVAAGVFYGLADAAIKAVSLHLGADGLAALLSVWTAVAAVGTFAGFLAFQSSLLRDSAVTAISLMNGLAALVALGCGLQAFGESLGDDAPTVIVHLLAVALVLACVPKLAAAQAELATGSDAPRQRGPASQPVAPGYGSPG
jgi:enterochelin esterase-like enzyme